MVGKLWIWFDCTRYDGLRFDVDVLVVTPAGTRARSRPRYASWNRVDLDRDGGGVFRMVSADDVPDAGQNVRSIHPVRTDDDGKPATLCMQVVDEFHERREYVVVGILTLGSFRGHRQHWVDPIWPVVPFQQLQVLLEVGSKLLTDGLQCEVACCVPQACPVGRRPDQVLLETLVISYRPQVGVQWSTAHRWATPTPCQPYAPKRRRSRSCSVLVQRRRLSRNQPRSWCSLCRNEGPTSGSHRI